MTEDDIPTSRAGGVDHVIEEERGIGEMLIMAIDDKIRLQKDIATLREALEHISDGEWCEDIEAIRRRAKEALAACTA